MRIATYNAENLFSRPKVMLYDSWDDGRQVLEDYASKRWPRPALSVAKG